MRTIELNGLLWDTENLKVGGKNYFTYEEAKAESFKLGKRLPTKEEFEELFRLQYIYDDDRNSILFAEIKPESKIENYLYLPANGFRANNGRLLTRIGLGGFYWSDTPNDIPVAYGLSFSKSNFSIGSYGRNNQISVRCVQDIKPTTIMETKKVIEFNIPEGYIIDNSKSTGTKIVCKPIEPKYPKSWNEAFISEVIKGYYVEGSSIGYTSHNKCTIEDRYTFKAEKQAASALAYAQLTQLMALPCYNGDWTPNWDCQNQEKYCITRLKSGLVKLDYSGYFSFLAFKSKKVRDEFYHNHMDLIKQFYELWQPVKS